MHSIVQYFTLAFNSTFYFFGAYFTVVGQSAGDLKCLQLGIRENSLEITSTRGRPVEITSTRGLPIKITSTRGLPVEITST